MSTAEDNVLPCNPDTTVEEVRECNWDRVTPTDYRKEFRWKNVDLWELLEYLFTHHSHLIDSWTPIINSVDLENRAREAAK